MACKGSRLGSALPCPAGRSVPGRGGPERRSVRDRTGPEPAGTRWVHPEPAGRGLQRAPAVTTGAKEPQVRPPAQPPPGTTSGDGPEFESPTYQLGCCWPRSARRAAWPTPATCWTAPPMASCWMTTAPLTRRKSRPRIPNCSPAGGTTPSGSAATSARAPGPAKPNKELWASSSPGRARYGATGTGGSLRVG